MSIFTRQYKLSPSELDEHEDSSGGELASMQESTLVLKVHGTNRDNPKRLPTGAAAWSPEFNTGCPGYGKPLRQNKTPPAVSAPSCS